MNSIPSPEDLRDLIRLPVQHPLLLVDVGSRESLRDRVKQGRWKRILEEKLKYCDEALKMPIQQLPRSLYDDYFRTGRRFPFEMPYDYRRRMTEDLALAYILTGSPEYLDRCRDYIWAIIEEFTWVKPAHVALPLSPEAESQVDLFSSGTALLLADLWDLFQNELDPETLKWMRHSILRKVLIPLRDHYNAQRWTTRYESNWCGVCCGNSGSALILTALDEPWAGELLSRFLQSIDRFLATADPDGAWVEGVGYWFYGFSRVIYLYDLLARVTNGRLDLLDDPRIKATATFPVWAYLPPQSQVNFGDTGSVPTVYVDVLQRLLDRYRIPSIEWYMQQLEKNNLLKGGTIRDLLWAHAGHPEPSPPDETAKWYRSIGVIVTRASWTDQDSPTLAVKAGHNAEPHGHLDVGQFIYHCYGNNFIRDVGIGIYDRKYFGKTRFENSVCNAEGHNLIFVDGKSQAPGRQHEGRIVEYDRKPNVETIRIDLTKAYPEDVLSKAFRTLLFCKHDGLVLTDEVRCRRDALVESRLHFKGKVEIVPSGVRISAEKGQVLVTTNQSSLTSIKMGAHSNLKVRDPETVNAEYIRLLARAADGQTRIRAFMIPHRTEEELAARLGLLNDAVSSVTT